jgi:hypothetical protein
MRLPQVSERIKEAPAQALRGVFAGIGQLLLITDKLRNKTPAHPEAPQAQKAPQAAEPPQAPEPKPATEPQRVPEATVPEAPQGPEAGAPAPAPPAAEAQKDFDKTGNVRLIPEATATPEPVAAEAPAVPAAAQPAAAVAAEPAAAAAAVAEPATAVAVAPLPNYDELTIASLRARLRNLSIDQVREMAEYERAHAARPEVITMFERRVAKLEAGA